MRALGLTTNTSKKATTPFLTSTKPFTDINQDVPDFLATCPRCKHTWRTGKVARKVEKEEVQEYGQYGQLALKVLMKAII